MYEDEYRQVEEVIREFEAGTISGNEYRRRILKAFPSVMPGDWLEIHCVGEGAEMAAEAGMSI